MLSKLKSLKNHQNFMKYFKNTSWLFAEKILRMLVGLFVGIWIARYLGPEQFGLLSYALSFVGLFSIFATLGLDSIVVRELIKDHTTHNKILGTALILKLFGSFIVLSFLAIAIFFTNNDTYTNILIFIIASATIFQSFNVIDFFFQSQVLSKYVVYTNIISLLLSSTLKIILIILNAPLITFAFVLVFDSFVIASGLIYFYIKHSNRRLKNINFSKDTAIVLLQNSWPLILSGLVISIYMKIDQVMIKDILGNEAVGQYAAAIRIIEPLYIIPNIIAQSLFPMFLQNKDNISLNNKLIIFYSFLIFLGLAIGLILSINAQTIILLLYGDSFFKSIEVFSIYSLSLFLIYLSIGNGRWFIIKNLQRKVFYRTTIAMFINIYLNYILIPIYGLVGAAYATFISYLFGVFFSMLFFQDTRENFFLSLQAFNLFRLIKAIRKEI